MSFSDTQYLFSCGDFKGKYLPSLNDYWGKHHALITSMDKLSRAQVGQFGPYPTPPYYTLPYPPYHYPTLPYPTLPYPTLPYPYHTLPLLYTTPTLPLPYPTLPFPSIPLPYPTMPCHAMPCHAYMLFCMKRIVDYMSFIRPFFWKTRTPLSSSWHC